MKAFAALSILVLLVASQAGAFTVRSVAMTPEDIGNLMHFRENLDVHCMLSYSYLLADCGFVTVVGGIEENETFGVHFDMTETVPFHSACDTAACLTLDEIEIVLYDVLAAPNDQAMNLRIYGSDASGQPFGELLGNRDFTPASAPGAFTTLVIDFTNGGAVSGLDLSGSRGNFVALLTWKNTTGHPDLVLDNVSTCVSECATSPACCQMGTYPYVYPRTTTHMYYYGVEPTWAFMDPIADPGGEETYGYLEGLWASDFCKSSSAAKPSTLGSIKAIYR
jgi:hypothetical protein